MTIEVFLTPGEFFRFTMFDTFRRKKMWQSPVIFASILTVCAMVCFYLHHIDGAVMLGTVLMVVGLGLAIFYFVSFFLSLFLQIRKQGLPRAVYTLTLTNTKEFHIANATEQIDYPWKKVYHAYHGKTATYLYATPARAFILPHYFVEGGAEELWKLISKKLPADKLTVL